MTTVLRIRFSVATAAASGYSMHVSEPGLWSWAFLGRAAVVLLPLPVPRLDALARDTGEPPSEQDSQGR